MNVPISLPIEPSLFSLPNSVRRLFWKPSLTPSGKALCFTFVPTFYPLIFSFDESAPIVFLLFVCGISVCLNEISMTDGKSVVGISVHSHGECWATGIGFRFGVGGREWVWVWDSCSSCMRDAGPYLFFRFQLRIASCGKPFMTTDSACVRAC